MQKNQKKHAKNAKTKCTHKIFNMKQIKNEENAPKKKTKSAKNCTQKLQKSHQKCQKWYIGSNWYIARSFTYWLSPITRFHHIGYPRWWWWLLFVLAETKISPKLYNPRVLPTIRDCLEGLASLPQPSQCRPVTGLLSWIEQGSQGGASARPCARTGFLTPEYRQSRTVRTSSPCYASCTPRTALTRYKLVRAHAQLLQFEFSNFSTPLFVSEIPKSSWFCFRKFSGYEVICTRLYMHHVTVATQAIIFHKLVGEGTWRGGRVSWAVGSVGVLRACRCHLRARFQ